MLSLILFLVALLLVIWGIVYYTKRVCDNTDEEPTQEFPPLEETIVVPEQPKETKKLWFDYKGVPCEVHISNKGAYYILRNRARDNAEYRDYLSEEEKKSCYEK